VSQVDVTQYISIVDGIIGRLRARGLPWWAQADDLRSVGLLALVEHPAQNGALAHVTARNAIIDAIKAESIRQRDRVDDVTEEGESLTESAERSMDEGLDLERVFVLASFLRADWYRVIVMRFCFGMKSAEVAERLGVTEHSVEVVVSKSRAALKARLNPDGEVSAHSIVNHNEGIWTQRVASHPNDTRGDAMSPARLYGNVPGRPLNPPMRGRHAR